MNTPVTQKMKWKSEVGGRESLWVIFLQARGLGKCSRFMSFEIKFFLPGEEGLGCSLELPEWQLDLPAGSLQIKSWERNASYCCVCVLGLAGDRA